MQKFVCLYQFRIQDELIPMTQNLSQDAEWTIRASMCAQLVSIVKGLTKNGESSEKQVPVRVVLSVLFELGDDEVEAVRLVVVETASAILQYLDEGFFIIYNTLETKFLLIQVHALYRIHSNISGSLVSKNL